MKIKPLYDRVLILPKSQNKPANSGLILPETSFERPQFGEIVAVGDGENLDGENTGMKVTVGDNVLFNRFAGAEVKLEGVSYIVLRQIDIIGVLYD